MEPVFEIRFVPTHKMISENMRKYGIGPRIPTVIICAIVFVAMIGYLCWVGLWERMRTFVIVLLALEIAVFFIPDILTWARGKMIKKQNGGKLLEAVITVAHTIEYREGPWDMHFEYADLTGVLHLKHSYKLRFVGRKSLLLDPDGFTKGTFSEFKQFLREKRPDLNIPE